MENLKLTRLQPSRFNLVCFRKFSRILTPQNPSDFFQSIETNGQNLGGNEKSSKILKILDKSNGQLVEFRVVASIVLFEVGNCEIITRNIAMSK